MNDIIEIAKDHCFSRQVVDGETVLITFRSQQLQQFAQRIEAQHKQRIAELEKDCDILATNYDAARRASRFSADVADQALADLKAAEKQIEQLREALSAANWFVKNFPSSHIPSDMDFVTPIELIDKALEQTK